MVKRLKNIWFGIDILLIILCAFFYLLANPILWKSGVARTPNLGCTLLSLLCLTAKLPSTNTSSRTRFGVGIGSWP